MDRRLEKLEGTQKNQVWTLIILLGRSDRHSSVALFLFWQSLEILL
ncbi:hypothetical protein N0824_01072 [Microcystis sp. 0824]|nr:hypothetical protein N0824_01072 [Microcystis sp. 0824]